MTPHQYIHQYLVNTWVIYSYPWMDTVHRGMISYIVLLMIRPLVGDLVVFYCYFVFLFYFVMKYCHLLFLFVDYLQLQLCHQSKSQR